MATLHTHLISSITALQLSEMRMIRWIFGLYGDKVTRLCMMRELRIRTDDLITTTGHHFEHLL